MMTMPFHLAGMALPISPALPDLLRSAVREQRLDLTDLSTLTFNFRSPGYSAETGGVHPVELRLIRGLHGWVFDYITDFSYQGTVYPELEKEIDISWSQQYVFLAYRGDLPVNAGRELFELWQSNFIQYHAMNIYTITVLWES